LKFKIPKNNQITTPFPYTHHLDWYQFYNSWNKADQKKAFVPVFKIFTQVYCQIQLQMRYICESKFEKSSCEDDEEGFVNAGIRMDKFEVEMKELKKK
jgi:hypothetical protein